MSSDGSTLLFEHAMPGRVARQSLRTFARRLQQEVASGRSFCCLLTTDRELRRLNRRFRDRDEVTDVLSFPSGVVDGPLGDVAISVDRAGDQALRYGHSLDTEIRILMLHGVLHLTGMNHSHDGGRMRNREIELRRLGLPLGLIERASS
jgi:probable rRNA maturation factor